ncbi:hypothetical protein [Flavobacterium sp.]|uniref:hypothetical protein n=1 Tax=Flavobacterium sp. TaxID=239 RepID=UPI0025C66C9D|nr:hypothetical protein [Flavobacterium sp.]
MATNINTILSWFKTGEKPTQKQFWDSWQSFWHKDEQIPQSSVANLKNILDTKADQLQFEAHKIDRNAHNALFSAKEDKSQKGIAEGYAPLNNFTKLASQYLDIVNDLVTGGSSSLLSAEQGKILKNQINSINLLLTSDNTNLDTVQKIVDAIETLQNSLNTILVNDLTTGGADKALTAEMGKSLQSNKVDKSSGKSLLSDSEITRLATLSNYIHPANHSPEIIVQNSQNRFVTDTEKAIWNAKQAALNYTPENTIHKNTANGYAGLGADGKLISSQLPSITVNNTFVIDSETKMLALAVETGDVAVRSDINKSFILKGTNPLLIGDWQELLTPTSDVTTVFGRNGAITAQTGDYTADQILETQTKKFQSAKQQAFNDATSSIQTQLDAKISNATHTGDAIGATSLTVKGINGKLLSELPTGILKNTTSTGVPVIATVRTDYAEPTTTLATGILKNTTSTGAHTIATASDFPILNQDTTGTASNSINLAGQPFSYFAPVNSPTFLGIPKAPTAAPGTYSDQLATTSFVTSALSALNSFVDKTSIQTISGSKTFTNSMLTNGISNQFSSTTAFISNTAGSVQIQNSLDGGAYMEFGSFFRTDRSYRIGVDTDGKFKIGHMSDVPNFIYNKANGNLQISSLTSTTLTGGNNTDGYLPLASTGGLLKNSVVFQKANNIGIGVAAPTAPLHVLGGIRTETVAPIQGTTVGSAGEIRAVAGFIYVCSGGTVWTRAALTTF